MRLSRMRKVDEAKARDFIAKAFPGDEAQSARTH